MEKIGALSFDVEDYFQVSAFENQIDPKDWDSFECRVASNIEKILALLDAQNNTKATFFILGWIAERYPEMVKRIAENGHEIASHGYNHQRLSNMSASEFKADVSSTKQLLEDLTGHQVAGYRAPSFSVSQETPWFADILKASGYEYSSSINPVPHDFYGLPDAPRTPFRWSSELLEIPVTTLEIFNKRLPCSGGGFFRLYPYSIFKKGLSLASQQLHGPVIFYLHPWELDPEQPRIAGASAKSKFRHYLNLRQTEPRLASLLRDFNWCKLNELDIFDQSINTRYQIKAA